MIKTVNIAGNNLIVSRIVGYGRTHYSKCEPGETAIDILLDSGYTMHITLHQMDFTRQGPEQSEEADRCYAEAEKTIREALGLAY